MKRRVPKNYRVREGCWDCVHKFIKSDYDDESEYYCAQDKTKRPACGSVVLNECFGDMVVKNGLIRTKSNKEKYYKEYTKLMDAWEKWAEEHRVAEAGYCSKWRIES